VKDTTQLMIFHPPHLPPAHFAGLLNIRLITAAASNPRACTNSIGSTSLCFRIELQRLVDPPGMPGEAQAARAAIDLIKAQRFRARTLPDLLVALRIRLAPAIGGARAAMALPSSPPAVARTRTVCAAIAVTAISAGSRKAVFPFCKIISRYHAGTRQQRKQRYARRALRSPHARS
jgi:hypothetical protein